MGDDSPTASTGASTDLVRDSEFIRRFRAITKYLAAEVQSGPSNYARMGFVLDTITDELIEEMRDMPETQVRMFLFYIGQTVAWIGHGDNEALPEFLRAFAEQIQPTKGYDERGSDARSLAELDSGSG